MSTRRRRPPTDTMDDHGTPNPHDVMALVRTALSQPMPRLYFRGGTLSPVSKRPGPVQDVLAEIRLAKSRSKAPHLRGRRRLARGLSNDATRLLQQIVVELLKLGIAPDMIERACHAAAQEVLREHPAQSIDKDSHIGNAKLPAAVKKKLRWNEAKALRTVSGEREFANVAEFVERHFADLRPLGFDQAHLKQHDPIGYARFHQWCTYHNRDSGHYLPRRRKDALSLSALLPEELRHMESEIVRAVRAQDHRGYRARRKMAKPG